MKDNIIGILNQLRSNMERYEGNISRDTMTPYELVLDTLEHDYCRFYNHDQWLDALRQFMTVEEAEVWNIFPEFTKDEPGATLAEALPKLRPELHSQAQSLVDSLVAKGWIYECPDNRYEQTYLLDVIFSAINYYDGSPLHKVCVDWWLKVTDDGNESVKLRTTMSEHRVLPHEATLTGDSKYGRIPMNLEIPDTRQILDIDRTSEFLKRCRRFAVVDCICRNAKDLQGGRECDYPTDVCLLFDESADGAIAWEMGREISYEETLEIIKKCRDMGLVQVISNAEHPLAMCNCCDCCCLCLRTASRNEAALLEVSRFKADVINQPDCIKCGACMNVCPNNAIDVQDKFISISTHKCYGCGLCVSKCPKAVLRMTKKAGAPDKLERDSLKRIYM